MCSAQRTYDMARQRKAKLPTETNDMSAMKEKTKAFRRRAGSWERVWVDGGCSLAARRVVSSTRAVRIVTSRHCPPKSAMGSELLRVAASVSTGAMVVVQNYTQSLDVDERAHRANATGDEMKTSSNSS